MSIVDNVKARDDFMYATQFHWFTGVIEDIMDPEQRGRVKVRCFGYHTEKKDYISTKALPWAHVMMPVTSAAQSGVGESATGILRGTWVVGFFRDGQTAQDPIVMGTLPSMTPEDGVDYQYGFSDPVKQYPYKDKLGDQDIPEEAISKEKKYEDSFSYKKKEEHRDLAPVAVAFSDTWELPKVKEIIKVEYPKNHVRAWERKVPVKEVEDSGGGSSTGILDKNSGKVENFKGGGGLQPKKEMHVQEFDVTPDYERISTMHKSGTYKEWTAKGDDTTVIVGDEFRIIVKNQRINIKGDCMITVEGNMHTLVNGDQFTHVMGNRTELIEGDLTQTVLGNVVESYDMNHMTTASMNRFDSVGMNSMTRVEQQDGHYVAAGRMTLINVAENIITLGNFASNTTGNYTKSVQGLDTLLIIGNHNAQYVGVRNEYCYSNSIELVVGGKRIDTSGSLLLCGVKDLMLGSTGNSSIFGNAITINDRFPVLIPI